MRKHINQFDKEINNMKGVDSMFKHTDKFGREINKGGDTMYQIKVVYMAGPIQHVSGEESKGWREQMTEILRRNGVETLDPTRNQHLKRFPDGTWDKDAIVELDIEDLNIADLLIAYTPKPSAGTSMEVLYMREVLNKPVFVVCEDLAQLSPWVEYFACEVFDSFDKLFEVMDKILKGDIKLTVKNTRLRSINEKYVRGVDQYA